MARKVITAVAVFILLTLVVSLGLVMATPALADTVTLSPNAVGNFDEWTLGAGADKVAAVSSNDGDTSYIKTSTQDYRQTFAFPGASVPAGSTINSVTVKVVAKRTAGGGPNQINIVAEKGTGAADISDGSIEGVGPTYAEKTRTMLTNPFTPSAWTVSEVNSWTTGGQGIRFGVRLHQTTNEVRVTQISVVVNYTPDVIAPTVVTIGVSDPLINEADDGGTFGVVATFSEAMDTGVTPTISFSPDVEASGTLTFASDAWSVGDTVYTATYDVADVDEEVADVDVSVGGAEDLAGNPQDPDPTTETALFDVDTVAPTVGISSTATDPTNISPIPMTATFSEDVTGFELGEITVGNGTANNFGGSGDEYTFDVTPTADGVVTVDIAGGVAQDAAGNPNTAAGQFSITYSISVGGPISVGGTVYPINKAAVLMPWLGLALVLILAVGGGTLALRKRRTQ